MTSIGELADPWNMGPTRFHRLNLVANDLESEATEKEAKEPRWPL